MFVDTFLGWTELFPTKQETDLKVVKKLLKDILSYFAEMIGSDNGPVFVSRVSQNFSMALRIDWK